MFVVLGVALFLSIQKYCNTRKVQVCTMQRCIRWSSTSTRIWISHPPYFNSSAGTVPLGTSLLSPFMPVCRVLCRLVLPLFLFLAIGSLFWLFITVLKCTSAQKMSQNYSTVFLVWDVIQQLTFSTYRRLDNSLLALTVLTCFWILDASAVTAALVKAFIEPWTVSTSIHTSSSRRTRQLTLLCPHQRFYRIP